MLACSNSILVAIAASVACAQPAVTTSDASAPTPAKSASSAPIQASLLREEAISTLESLANDSNPEIRANVVEAAGGLSSAGNSGGGRLRPIIERGLTDPSAAVQTVALMVVGRNKIKELAPLARTSVSSDNMYVKSAAIFALSAAGVEVDQTPLANILLNGEKPQIRAHAAFILGEIRNPSALGLLRQAAREKLIMASESQVKSYQLQIAEALVKLGDQSQIDTVRAALYSGPDDLEAVALAAQILGTLGDTGARNNLINLSVYKDRAGTPLPADVRLAVAAALAKLGEPDAAMIATEFVTHAEPAIRKQAAYVMGLGGKNALAVHLSTLLKDQDAGVRVAAADAILKFKR
ncbi:MAG: HEAT repeat domain-containing protein [Planctomycetes bacterium]|nr:HEAT repeat domain-containing protein [Planctomycetota bacterium]